MEPASSRKKILLLLAVYALAYWAFARIGLFFVSQTAGMASVWPASGLALAALLLSPRRYWPALFGITFTFNTLANLISGNSLPVSLGFAFANTLEPALGGYVFTRLSKQPVTFTRLSEVWTLLFVATVVNAVSASVGAWVPVLGFSAAYANVWPTWWLPDGLGILLATPLIIVWSRTQSVFHFPPLRKILEAAGLILSYGLILNWTFFHWFTNLPFPRGFLIFLPLLWTAFRFGSRSMTVAFAVSTVTAVYCTSKGIGTFAVGSHSLLVVQLFVCVICVTGLTLMAALAERKRSVEALSASELRFRSLFEQAADAVVLFDPASLRILDANESTVRLLGYSRNELLALRISDLDAVETPEETANHALRIMTNGPDQFETRQRRKDGAIRDIAVTASALTLRGETAVLTVWRDITEQKRTDETLQRVDKLESLGILAGGIAHDFNNLLHGLFNYLGLTQRRLKSAKFKEAEESLERALGIFDRARDLAQRLLTFSKGGDPIRTTQSLSAFLHETVSFVLSGSNLSPVFDIPPGDWNCEFDKSQMGRAIDNIVINARQAMPDGGVIEIRFRYCVADKAPHPLSKKDHYLISIRDHGPGIPAEIQPFIFDPFFTTKTMGSGLGLATSHSIVTKHEGLLEVESKPGLGTTFHIYLPVAAGNTVSATPSAVSEEKGQGRILVMDDEDFIRDTATLVLEELGYVVDAVPDGDTALAFAKKRADAGAPYAAAILDLTVPGGRGGREIVNELLAISPDCIRIAASGYAVDPVIAQPESHGFSASMAKPFMRDALAQLLLKLLKKS